MEELRQELYRCIQEYGPLHPVTVEVSQRLDVEILKHMKKCKNFKMRGI